jgi:NAD(P)-dependent dehydrogenase (short-subunit alcohol dehydrogenase family)
VTSIFRYRLHQLQPEDVLCLGVKENDILSHTYSSIDLISEGPVSEWKSVLDLNVLGLSICTKEALQSMRESRVDDGHIIHISRYRLKIGGNSSRPNVYI